MKHEEGVSESELLDPSIIENKIKAMSMKIKNKDVLLNEAICKNKTLKNSINHLRSEK